MHTQVNQDYVRKGRASANHTWSLDDELQEEEEELINAGGGKRPQEGQADAWCIQICCRSVAADMSSCWRDILMAVSCRAAPTLRCAGAACCVVYCGLMAAAILALLRLSPGSASIEQPPPPPAPLVP